MSPLRTAHFEVKSPPYPQVQMKLNSFLHLAISSYTRKGIQPSINQELKRAPNQLRKTPNQQVRKKIRYNKK
jgi:hypothetical protein